MWRPERSAKEPQTPSQASHGKTNGGNHEKLKQHEKERRPTIITVEKNGHERSWGPLSKTNAWRAGCFWQEMEEKVKVFLMKGGDRTEVEVLKRFERGRERVWFKEKTPQPPQQQPEPPRQLPEGGKEPVAVDADEESVTEDDPTTVVPTTGLSEEDPEERETQERMWIAEKITTLEKENGELKMAIQETQARLAAQEDTARKTDERCMRMETVIMQIAEFVQQQNATLESSRVLVNSLVEEVNNHGDNFKKLGLILQIHEQHIVQSGAITQEMAQYMNALIQENQQKSASIASLVNEYQAQTEVLRQHQLGLQVQAEVIKRIINGQHPQQQPQQGVAGTGLTVSEVDDQDRDHRDFQGVQNPNSGPPNNGLFGAVIQFSQVPTNLEIGQSF